MENCPTGIKSIIDQLRIMEAVLEGRFYAHPLPVLNHATLGQHIRHIHDFYKALAVGISTSVVDYNHRERNEEIELSLDTDMQRLETLRSFFSALDLNQAICILTSEGFLEEPKEIKSTIMRELMYGYDHAIHHLPFIIIVFESLHTIQLPSYFGVARSTLSFHKK